MAISEPVEVHAHGFCFLLFDGTIVDAIGGAVVGVNRCGRLVMAEFNEGEAKRDGESCIEKEGSNFSFGSRCHDILDDFGNDCNGAVDEQTVGVTEEDEATSTALGVAGYKVGSVAVNRKNHVAGGVHFGGIWVAGTVIEEVDDRLDGFLGAVGFGSGEIIEGVHHSVVQGLRNVNELAGDLFKAFGLFRCERREVVNCSELLLGTVLRQGEFGRGVEVLGGELILELK